MLQMEEADGATWEQAAELLGKAADLDGAEVAARRFVAACPDDVRAKSMLAGILGDLGRLDEAITIAQDVSARLPGSAEAHYGVGVMQARAGRLEAARRAFGRALELEPRHARALEYLAYLGSPESAADLLGMVDEALAHGNHDDPREAASLHYARATVLDREQRWQEAFSAFETGAGLMRTTGGANLDAMERYVERLKSGFSPEFFERHRYRAHSNQRPIFIVGMPRSGTTLVEAVLASHSDVLAAGESALVRIATMFYGSFEPTDLAKLEGEIAAGRSPWTEMGGALEKLHAARFGTSHRITEKNLGHHFLLGAIGLIATGAPILYCTRDPVATAWSCYRTRFTRGNAWSYDFRSIARYSRLYADLMSHWQAVLPGHGILEIRYEDLVADPRTVISRMLGHAGLEFEERCLDPHRASLPVATASLAQVRQPIHAKANCAWRHYEAWLTPYLHDLQR